MKEIGKAYKVIVGIGVMKKKISKIVELNVIYIDGKPHNYCVDSKIYANKPMEMYEIDYGNTRRSVKVATKSDASRYKKMFEEELIKELEDEIKYKEKILKIMRR